MLVNHCLIISNYSVVFFNKFVALVLIKIVFTGLDKLMQYCYFNLLKSGLTSFNFNLLFAFTRTAKKLLIS